MAEKTCARTRLLSIALLAVSLLAAGCSSGDEKRTPTATLSPTVRSVQSGTQMQVGDVRIGVANIWQEDYLTADGMAKRGLTAALFISVKDQPSMSRNVRAHPGLELDVPGYRLKVAGVEANAIHLDVNEAK
jgi:hypothetical protein